MWPWEKASGDKAERSRQESLEVARAQLRVAESDARVSASGRRVQIFGAAVAVLGVVISLLVWHPWARPSIPRAAIRLRPRSHNAVVPKPIGQIPKPPPYSTGSSEDHCDAWWRSWFETQGAAEIWPPTIELSAPTSADITVTGAAVRVFRSYVPAAPSFIECVHGAGPVSGTLLDVDLAHPAAAPTIVADDGSDRPLALPNAVINVNPGHTEYVAVTARGARRMYEWSVTLRVVVAQRTQTVVLGSRRHPLRSWLGKRPPAAYDYDMRAHSWKRAS